MTTLLFNIKSQQLLEVSPFPCNPTSGDLVIHNVFRPPDNKVIKIKQATSLFGTKILSNSSVESGLLQEPAESSVRKTWGCST